MRRIRRWLRRPLRIVRLEADWSDLDRKVADARARGIEPRFHYGPGFILDAEGHVFPFRSTDGDL